MNFIYLFLLISVIKISDQFQITGPQDNRQIIVNPALQG